MFNSHPSLLHNHIVSFSKRILQEEQIPIFVRTTSFTLLHRLIRTTLNQRRPNYLNRHQEEDKLPNILSAGRGEGGGGEKEKKKRAMIHPVRACSGPSFPSSTHSGQPLLDRQRLFARSARRRWREAEAADEADYFGHPSCLSDSDPLEIIQWSGCQRTLEHGNELFLVDPRPLDRSSRGGEGGPRFTLNRETSRYTVTVLAVVTDRSAYSGSASNWLRAESMLIPCYRYLDFELVFFIIFDDTS